MSLSADDVDQIVSLIRDDDWRVALRRVADCIAHEPLDDI
jgi:hypothetical protein